jgi:pimeloyl-ACP methyl ester carboxylesterase
MKPNIIYLHGFGSSPNARKAQAIRERLVASDIPLIVPDLNQPSFERLTLTAMLAHLAGIVRACPPGPVYLIGSSMGGLAAIHFVNRYKDAEARRVELLFLLAPAFDFMENRRQMLGEDGLLEWRRSGWWKVYNYANDREERIHYGLAEDIAAYDSFGAHVDIPVMIYHGKHDDVVSPAQSERFSADRSNVQLKLVESDHSLLDQIDPIYKDMVHFFAL